MNCFSMVCLPSRPEACEYAGMSLWFTALSSSLSGTRREQGLVKYILNFDQCARLCILGIKTKEKYQIEEDRTGFTEEVDLGEAVLHWWTEEMSIQV